MIYNVIFYFFDWIADERSVAYYFTMAAYGDLISGVKPGWAQVLRGMPNFDQPLTLVIHRN